MRKVALALVIMMLPQARGFALGLGDIQLHSALNERLDAEIRIQAAAGENLDKAKIGLAPAEVFSRAGVERTGLLEQLDFEFVRRDGETYVQVTSPEAVREPFLDFLVQVTWPAGRLVREYTLLLDPPVTTEAQAPATAAPATSEQSAATKPRSPQTSEPSQPQAPERAPVSAGRQEYGPTDRQDTLWQIAKQVSPDDVTPQQAMLALLKANPEAFYGNNVNNLKAGYVLRLPDRDDMTEMSHAQAVREVQRQHQRWQTAKRDGAAAGEDSQATPSQPASSPEASAQAAEEESSQLKLVAPEEEVAEASAQALAGGSEQAAGTDEASGKIQELEAELALSLETTDALRQENEELRSRLSALEEQISSLQELVVMKEDTLASMQDNAGQDDGAAGASESAPGGEQSQAQPAPEQTPSAAQGSLWERLLNKPSILGAIVGGVLLLLVLAWLVVRRRRMSQEMEDESFPEINEAQSQYDAEAIAEAEAAADSEGLDVLESEESEIDPLVEADVYLAYRRYQQAEELVNEALEKEPQRTELRLKLLEISYAAKDREKFEQQAQALYDLLGDPDDPVWLRAVTMGRDLCPRHPLFNDAGQAETPAAGSGMGAGQGAAAAAAIAGQAAAGDPGTDDTASEDTAMTSFDLGGDNSGLEASDDESVSSTGGAQEASASLNDDLDALLSGEALSTTGEEDSSTRPSSGLGDALGLSETTGEGAELAEPSVPGPDAGETDNSLDFDLSQWGEETPSAEVAPAAGDADAPAEDNSLDFDLAGLDDLGLGGDTADDAAATPTSRSTPDDQLAASQDSTDTGLAEAFDQDEKGVDIATDLSFADAPEGGQGSGQDELTEGATGAETPDPGAAPPSSQEEEWDTQSARSEFGTMDFGLSDDDLMAGADVVGTKLDLARAYIDMGDQDSARDILNEVIEEGSDGQKREAQDLMDKIA